MNSRVTVAKPVISMILSNCYLNTESMSLQGNGKFCMWQTLPSSSRVILLCLIVLLTACSSIKTLYNQLDWLLPWYLDDYVSLNDEQQGPFKKQLESAIQWHRQHQLPEYADFLDWLAASAEDGLDEVEIDSIYRELRQFIDLLIEGLLLQFIDIIEVMDEEQFRQFSDNLDDKNQQFKDKYINTPEAEQRAKRADKKLESIENWTGTVTQQQRQIVDRWSQSYLLMGAEYLESRLAWQQRLKQVLDQRNDSQFLQSALLMLVKQRRSLRSESFLEKKRFNDNRDKRLYLELDRSLTSQQRVFLLNRLRSTARDFRELAEQGS